MRRPTRADRANAGFTLVEVLAALAVVASVLTAVGAVVASNAFGTRKLEQSVALVQTARMIAADVPHRDELGTGDIAGELFAHRWQVRSLPLAGVGPAAQTAGWVPYQVMLRVRSPSGAVLSIETIRLRKLATKSR